MAGEGPASWGVELWDCEKKICERCEDGLALVSFTREFVKERAKLEQHYAKELQKLVETNRKDFKAILQKTPKQTSTVLAAWDTILEETGHIVKQHDAIAESLTKNVTDPMKLLIKAKKAEKDGHAKRLAKLAKDSDKAENAFDSKRKTYEKASRERAEGQAKAEAARHDTSVAPVKLKKMDSDVSSLESKEAAARAEYDIAHANVERFRRQLYTQDLRKVFDDMQRMDMEREQAHADQIAAYARAYTSVHNTMGSCLDGMAAAAATINCAADSSRFVERTKTGNPPEMKITAATSTKKMLTAEQVNKKRVTKSKIFKTTSRKKDAIREDLGHLPPQQREREFRERLAAANAAREREVKAKVGFEKTIDAYSKNPAMGDKKSTAKLQAELETSNKKIAELDQEIMKLNLYLEAFQASKEQGREEEDWDDDDGDDDSAADSSGG